MLQILAMLLVAVASGPDRPSNEKAIRVTPTQIAENRTAFLTESAEESAGWQANQLTVKLHVEGTDADRAHSYGKVEVQEALDDLKTDLKPKQRGGFFADGDEMQPVRDESSWSMRGRPEKGFEIELALDLPSRKAAKLSRLKGQFDVRLITDSKTLEIKKLKNPMGTDIEDKTLASVGLKLRILKPGEKSGFVDRLLGGGDDQDDSTIRIRFEGNLEAIKDAKIQDAQGNDLTQGSFSSSTGSSRVSTYNLRKPVDDTTVLKLELIGDSKTITVPFQFGDLTLP